MGCSKLRVLALYEQQEMRTRMQRLLVYHFNRPELAAGLPGDEIVEFGCHTEVPLCTGLRSRCPTAATTTGAEHSPTPCPDSKSRAPGSWLVETDYDAEEWDHQRRAARREEEGAVGPYALDAKPGASRHLARHGVLAQFLTPTTRKPRSKKKERKAETPLKALGMQLATDFPGPAVRLTYLRSLPVETRPERAPTP